MFLHFWQKFEKSKWLPFLGRENFFENCQEYIAQIPCGSKLSTKSLYLARFRRYVYVFCYVAITQEVKAIIINNNTKQAIDPINLHTNF